MKKLFFIFILLSAEAFALEAVVTVLETPMFKFRSYDAPVVQYLRKGDVIKIHPSIANDRRMDQYAPAPEKMDVENTFYAEDEFIPTLDRQGNTVYVLSEHIYIYFNDAREFEQRINKEDPTDYRLEEPLPKNYPLKTITGYRGQFLMGITQPYYESYPYKDSVRTEGYTTPIDLNMTLMRLAPGNYQDRMFIGGTLNFRTFENSYTFEDRRLSEEKSYKLGIGPTISYDAFKGDKNRVNLTGTIILNFLDRFYIDQSLDERQDSRHYIGYSFSPRLHLQYHRKDVLEELDFVLGTSMEIGPATTFRAKNAGKEPTWWHNLGDDKFTTRTTFTLGGYIGVQSAY